jgi:phage tail protein X
MNETKVTITDPFLSVEDACWRYLRTALGDDEQAARLAASGFVEAAYERNPGLALAVAGNGDSIPVGTVVIMPAIEATAETETVNLWE